MKYFFLIVLSIIVTQSIFGQCKLTIIQEGKKCELMNNLAAFAVDPSPADPKRINDSTLEFTFDITEPAYLFILIDDVRHGDTSLMWNWRTRFWLTPEINHRELIINYDTKTVQVKDLSKWVQTTELDGKSKMTLNNLSAWDSITQTTCRLEDSGKFKEEVAIESSYIEQYPDSYLSLWLYSHSHALSLESDDKKLAIFNKLSPSLSKYSDYHEMKADLSGARKYPNAGDTFKEFTLTDVRGKNFNSKSIKNKWILLHFWSNGCGPCVREMDDMVKYYNTLDTSKIAFISITLDENRDKWKKAPTTNKIKWTNLWEPDGAYGDLCLNYNLPAMPFFVLFNSEKKLVIMQDGADAIETTIKGYLSSVK